MYVQGTCIHVPVTYLSPVLCRALWEEGGGGGSPFALVGGLGERESFFVSYGYVSVLCLFVHIHVYTVYSV